MEEELVHLKTKNSFQKKENLNRSEEIIHAFKNACLHLDASLFEPYMQEDDCFEDLDKYRFLASLKSVFEGIKQRTKDVLEVTMGDSVCQGCSYGKPIVIFDCCSNNGNRLVGSFGYLIDMEGGILKDIYQCNGFRLRDSGFNEEVIESILKKYRPE